jgi:hypothetical protein
VEGGDGGEDGGDDGDEEEGDEDEEEDDEEEGDDNDDEDEGDDDDDDADAPNNNNDDEEDEDDGEYDPESVGTALPALPPASSAAPLPSKPKVAGGFIMGSSDDEDDEQVPIRGAVPGADAGGAAVGSKRSFSGSLKSPPIPITTFSAPPPVDVTIALEARIAEDRRGDMDAWLALIGAHRSRHDPEGIRTIFNRFLEVFPHSVGRDARARRGRRGRKRRRGRMRGRTKWTPPASWTPYCADNGRRPTSGSNGSSGSSAATTLWRPRRCSRAPCSPSRTSGSGPCTSTTSGGATTSRATRRATRGGR